MTITAQDLYNFTKCAHRVYLDSNGDPSERGEVSPFVKLLWEMGLQTERAYIEKLGDLKPENLQSLSPDDAWPATLRLMEEGADQIYQGCLKNEHWVGRPDLLLKRTDGHSRFGDFYYEPLDIKAGKGWEEREGKKPKFKEYYAFQILFYRELLVRVQGYVPPVARMINVDGEIGESGCPLHCASYLKGLFLPATLRAVLIRFGCRAETFFEMLSHEIAYHRVRPM